MNVLDEILEEMDDLLDKSSSMPLMGHKKIIDGERMRELINDIRLNKPQQIKDAERILKEEGIRKNKADAEAAAIIQRAEERAAELISRETIVRETKKRCMDMIHASQKKIQESQVAAMNSIMKMFSEAERIYKKNLQEISAFKSKMEVPQK